MESQNKYKNWKRNQKQQKKNHTLEEHLSGVQHQNRAWFWRWTPKMGSFWALNARTGMVLAFNARNGTQMGVERPKWPPTWRWTPRVGYKGIFTCLMVQGCKCLDTSGSVDPTGSSQHLWTPQDPHLPSLTLFSLLNHPLFPINTHPFCLPFTTHTHTPTYLQKFNISSPPNPTHMAEYTSPSISSISSSSSSILSSFARGRATF